MKKSPAKILSSLIAIGLTAGALPARADKAAIESAEASVKTFETRAGTSNPSYTGQLLYLASVYHSNGMNKEADATFSKAVDICKKQPDRKAEIPGMMLSWAMTLVSRSKAGDAEMTKAEKVLLEGLALANALPAASKERINYLIGTASFYRTAGKKAEEQARLKAADEHLAGLEKTEKLSNEDITTTAASLVQLAAMYTPPIPNHVFRMMPPVQIIADNAPSKPNTIKSKDFKTAEALQLRAIAQYDRLPETVPWRIEAHRKLVLWYRHFGQAKEEEFQTQQLSKLMHTTDRAKLFPQPAPCPACGMG